MNRDIAGIRKNYSLETLDEKNIAADAIDQFTAWWDEAVKSEIDEVNAMTLATATPDGKPSARIVLLKGYDTNGFVFFTNYSSNKGHALELNPHTALVFFWKELERQIRIEGIAEKVSDEESDAYFFSRPVGSRIGAWASPQSTIISNREILDENVSRFTQQFGENIPRPPHWGGFRIKPDLIEFWQGRSSRLHDRIRYSRASGKSWTIERLAP
ncbi:pyridoxamine 5'-phosphate oxidase [soil metagenome]